MEDELNLSWRLMSPTEDVYEAKQRAREEYVHALQRDEDLPPPHALTWFIEKWWGK